MPNNLDHIKHLLEFSSGDDFYFCQILLRKKEHSELGSNSRMIKSYYLKSLNQIKERINEIESICNALNGRCYINLNRRSFRNVGFHTMEKITNQLLNNEFPNIKAAYDHSCGKYSNEPNKKWIVDVDNLNFKALAFKSVIYNLEPLGDKFLGHVPTKNGYHIITKPFNRQKLSIYQEDFPEISLKEDVKTDNSTLLYWS